MMLPLRLFSRLSRAQRLPRAPARAGCARSQREPEEECVFAARERRIVIGADRDLLEADGAIKMTCADVGGPHFEIDDLAAGCARDLDHVREECASHALVLPLGCDG